MGRCVNAVNANNETYHGMRISSIIARETECVRFHFYQLVHGDGEFRDRDLIEAMGIIQHIIGEIDIINLSAGLDHAGNSEKDCTPDCSECFTSKKVKEVIENEATMVAAAGDELQTDDMCCPGTMECVISAAGVVAKCTADTESNSSSSGILGPSQDIRPPNAFWMKSNHENHIDGKYCTNRGCSFGMNCLENRRYVPWEPNHEPGQHSPDILAPVLITHNPNDQSPFISGGSSFAPPYVTSQLASVLCSLREIGRTPEPSTIRRAIRDAQKEIPDSEIGMLSGYELGDWFGDRYGVPFERASDDDTEPHFTVVDTPSD